MAGDYIIMRLDLCDDPDVIRIAKLTGLEVDSVIGKLHKIWSWADRHTRDGSVTVDAEYCDTLCAHSGFFDAMCDVGWASRVTDGIKFLNFQKHNGKNAKSRADGRKRTAKWRNKVTKNGDKSVTDSCHKNVTREEKRREENINPKVPTEQILELPESLKPAEDSVREWIAYKAERGKGYKPRGLKGLITQFSEWGPQRTAAAIRHSIASNYDGVFEPRAGPGTKAGSQHRNPAHAQVNHESKPLRKISLEEAAKMRRDGRPGQSSDGDSFRLDAGH